MVATVAIAWAAEMIQNLDVVISFRSTTHAKSMDTFPIILIAYDSRKDSFGKIKKLFKHIIASNATPEGLCFEAILKEIPIGNRNLNSYFLNMSDGYPYMDISSHGHYGGRVAEKHTRKIVGLIRRNGIKVISYFISDDDSSDDRRSFRYMYGVDSEFINTRNIIEISKSMNKRFLSEK